MRYLILIISLLFVGVSITQAQTTCYDLQPQGVERTDSLCISVGDLWTATPTSLPTATATATSVPTFTPTSTVRVTPTHGIATVTPTVATPTTGTRIVGPDDYTTIQAAVAASVVNDVIVIHTGIYPEQVNVNHTLTLQPFGDGPVWIDGGCTRANGVVIDKISDVVIRGLNIKRTNDQGILIENQSARTIVDGNTIQDYNCAEATGGYHSGVAAWYAGPGQQITNNVITRRVDVAGTPQGYGDGIWFKSNTANQSGGKHYLANNIIVGGWDGIGGEVEYDIHGSFDHDSIIEKNQVSKCGDDGIQSEGGGANITIQDNVITDCGVGVALATPLTGPTTVQRNVISSGVIGTLGSYMCFKTGNNSTAVVIIKNNSCTLPLNAGAGLQQTNNGTATYQVSGNRWNVGGYIFSFGYSTPTGSSVSFDADCMATTDPTRFIKWGTQQVSLLQFQMMGYEKNGTKGPC